jgi:hypothetical protein
MVWSGNGKEGKGVNVIVKGVIVYIYIDRLLK